MWLDLVPKGRNEVGGVMSWLKLHDEYDRNEPQNHGCCR